MKSSSKKELEKRTRMMPWYLATHKLRKRRILFMTLLRSTLMWTSTKKKKVDPKRSLGLD